MWHLSYEGLKWNVANLHLTSVWSASNTLFFLSSSQTLDKQERGNTFFFLHLNNMEKKGSQYGQE